MGTAKAMGIAMAMGIATAIAMAMAMGMAMATPGDIHGNRCFKNPLGTQTPRTADSAANWVVDSDSLGLNREAQ